MAHQYGSYRQSTDFAGSQQTYLIPGSGTLPIDLTVRGVDVFRIGSVDYVESVL